MFKNRHLYLCLILLLSGIGFGASRAPSLKGVWEYRGGRYNGKLAAAPVEYRLQRKYSKNTFETLLLEPDTTPQRFQVSNYVLTADSCTETEIFSKIPSKLTGVPVHYGYTLRHDTLTLSGRLPTGMVVQEYWVKQRLN